MSAHAKVSTANGRMIKRNQAIRRVEQCLSAWVEYPNSIRDLTLAETIRFRSAQTDTRPPLPFAELPSCVFRWPGHEGYLYAERMRSLEANQFASLQTHET